jgi:hypothetical protein
MKMRLSLTWVLFAALGLVAQVGDYDLVIRSGRGLDGNGNPWIHQGRHVGWRRDFRFDTRPEGIDCVLVNGQVVIDQGKHTGARPGQVLYGSLWRAPYVEK